MLSLLKPLIVNITILFSLTFNANLFISFNDKKPLTLSKKIFYGIIAAFTAVLCMFYPIETLRDTNFDFRMLVIMIVTMYVGLLAGVICTIPVILFRMIIGGEYAFIGILISLSALFIAAIFRKKFIHSNKRIFNASWIFSLFFIFYLFMIFVSVEFLSLQFYLVYFILCYGAFISLILVIEKLIIVNKQVDETIYLDKLSTVGQMAASFAHEVRNPLATVRGFIQFLEQDTTDINFKKFAPLILDELDRTNKIITDYLQVTKPSKLFMTNIALNQVLINTIELLRPLGTFKNVKIEHNLDKDCIVYGDEQYLKQCLLNIIKNGIEAIDKCGYVKISTCLHETDHKVIIKIEDNGRGMSAEELEKIGLPFYTTKSKGTGIGSMVTNRLIREMNGKIEYSSKVSKGTIVEITLPLSNRNKK